ncbi:MAG TPA: VOC family protein [Candidatus Nanopelagicaceae bacterium]|nr:VOC family protein [Candidatus Nanopelagicaceae bacterium]
MPEIVIQIAMDVQDLQAMAKFWLSALNYVPGVADLERYADSSATYYSILDPAGSRPKVILQRVPEARTTKNRLHLDLHVPDIEIESQRLLRIGASRIDQIPIEEAGAVWIRMADPEGNEFCLVRD